jgi:hypothetical protein
MLEFFGYSERGIINALVSDIIKASDPTTAVRRFINWFSFPLESAGASDKFGVVQVERVTIIVEQSFSDFGDLDILLLIDHDGLKKTALLVEAKVKTSGGGNWRVLGEWQRFLSHVSRPDPNAKSNLFVQLYRKAVLCDYLRGRPQVPRHSVRLPADPVSRNGYCLGGNAVVLRAADMLLPYAENAYFAMLLPDEESACRNFLENEFRQFSPERSLLRPWNHERFGFATWGGVHRCLQHNPAGFETTLATFRYNEGQIYSEPAGRAALQQALGEGMYKVGDRPVWLRQGNIGPHNCRVIYVDTAGDYFPLSDTVNATVLEPLELPAPANLLPVVNTVYLWDPIGSEGEFNSTAGEPAPPCQVRVVRVGIKESRVVPVDATGGVCGERLLVRTSHLRRHP